MTLTKKIILSVLIAILIPALYFFIPEKPRQQMVWGVSFSKKAAEGLGLDWRPVYLAILDDLKVSHLRLSSYWDLTEPQEGEYDFADLDFMVEQANSRDRKIVLTLGQRQPRWPECHTPDWVKDLPQSEKNSAQLRHVETVVDRYRKYNNIIAWQVENEYFLSTFGICPKSDESFLGQEIATVRKLDNRPILMTDSGEMSLWFKAASYGDIFGTTMYRRAYNPMFGVANWPHPAVYYSRLGDLVKFFSGPKKIIIAELQAEPWAKTTLQDDSTEENYKTLSPDQFKNNLQYARESGLSEAYLWGVEWWYYMKTKRDIPVFWESAKELWRQDSGE